jgi:ABC-type Mn2+/Zn2+ transport system permease subunit
MIRVREIEAQMEFLRSTGAISVAGVLAAEAFRFPPGPTIVLLGVGLFLLSLSITRKSLLT